jgi:hypothetical protein
MNSPSPNVALQSAAIRLLLPLRSPLASLLTASMLLVPGATRASDPNQLGLFYDTAGTVSEISIGANTQHALYLVLLEPVNDNWNGGGLRDVGYVAGFECGIEPPTGDFLLGVEFPLPAVNVGSNDNLIVGYAGALPVSGSRTATLATVRVFSFGDNRAGYLLSPASPQSISGVMAYVDAEDSGDNLVGMLPVSGAFDRAVFWFGNWHPKENACWGEVKSLFRQ